MAIKNEKIGYPKLGNFFHELAAFDPLALYKHLGVYQSILQLTSCVCRSWLSTSRDLVLRFFESKESYSDWVLRHFENSPKLRLSWHGNRIQDETIMKMTNLHSLYIKDPKCEVSAHVLMKLPNLTCLHLEKFQSPTIYNALSLLPYLKNLRLLACKLISNDHVKNLTNLTILEIPNNNSISDECLDISYRA